MSDGDARQVEAMAGYGLPTEDIAQVLRIDVEELRRRYADELEDGRIKANSRVAENLYRRATGEGREAVTAAIFWLKTRARWKEINGVEISDPNGVLAPTISITVGRGSDSLLSESHR